MTTSAPGADHGLTPPAEGGEIRAIADQLMDIMRLLRELEDQKRGESLGSDRFVALAEEAEVQGRLVFRWTGLQLEVARDAARRRAIGQLDAGLRIVDLVPRPLDRILAAWREAQVRLEIAKPGSDEAEEAAARIERLRDEYQAIAASQAIDAAKLAEYPAGSARRVSRTRRDEAC
jgi:hypothetical protein